MIFKYLPPKLLEVWNVLKKNFAENFDFLSIAPFLGKWLPFAFAMGIVAGFLASAVDFIILRINGFLESYPFLFFVYPLFVAYITALLIEKDPSIAGPGIGYAIFHLRTKRYVPFSSILLKFFAAILALSGTFIAGREGPSFYLGVALGEWLGKIYGFSHKYKPFLATVGAGAFTGALLKAPLGSAIFAMELEKTYNLNYKPFVPLLVASIVGYLTFSFFRGSHHFIPLAATPTWNLNIIPYIVFMGIIISLIVYIYSVVFHTAEYFAKQIKNKRKRLLLGTALALPIYFLLAKTISYQLLSVPAKMNILSYLAQNPIPVWKDILLIAGVITTTSLTLGFGISGGLVLPNLLIGLAIGNIFGNYFPNYIEVFTIAGMGAALAAGAKTPLAAIVMITEMTHTDVVIPMASAIVSSYIMSFGYHLYKGQIKEKPFDVEGI